MTESLSDKIEETLVTDDDCTTHEEKFLNVKDVREFILKLKADIKKSKCPTCGDSIDIGINYKENKK